MKLSQIKNHLATAETVSFQIPGGTFVPDHFHVTEVGIIDKHFIDCGGTVRKERVANFQLWNANDTEHRLKPQKLLDIISLSEKILGIEDLEIEVEYQRETIGKYSLEFNGTHFILLAKNTDCLAKENCGVPKQKLNLVELESKASNSCKPGGGCC